MTLRHSLTYDYQLNPSIQGATGFGCVVGDRTRFTPTNGLDLARLDPSRNERNTYCISATLAESEVVSRFAAIVGERFDTDRDIRIFAK